MNILTVDDNATNRKLLRVTLEAEGHTTLEAADGVEALQILNREKVDAIISDILMPNMDGFRFCHELRHADNLKLHEHLYFRQRPTTFPDRRGGQVSDQAGVHRGHLANAQRGNAPRG